jgi:hypothetical protein
LSLDAILDSGVEISEPIVVETNECSGGSIPAAWRAELRRQIARRHQDVLALIGLSITEIAANLGRSPRSVGRSVDLMLRAIHRVRSRKGGVREKI